jgi:hypothetical protein
VTLNWGLKITFFGFFEPFDEFLHLIHENGPTTRGMTLLIPFQNGILGNNIGLVHEQDNLVKSLEEGHVIIAVLLDPVEQSKLRLEVGRKCSKQNSVLAQMTQRLILEQIFLFVPFNDRHDAAPDLFEKKSVI